MKDILKEKSLKSMPYDVPEGYFDNLRKSLEHKTGERTWTWPAHVAAAAAFALLLAAGGFLLGARLGSDFMREDYIVSANALTEDDIIEYLIYTDTELEELY